MYPIRFHLVPENSAQTLDPNSVRAILTTCRTSDGTVGIDWARCRITGADLQVIAFVTAASPQQAVAYCRGALNGLTASGKPLSGWVPWQCSFGFRATPSAPAAPKVPGEIG
ncbi:hypothetical protein [Streptomyces sp. NPDC088812]|uniref:hypothetical protein n=1 Tax=Streptomyces sp. NPDC088812 TaxID=3365905 RepID=UPI0037FADC9E